LLLRSITQTKQNKSEEERKEKKINGHREKKRKNKKETPFIQEKKNSKETKLPILFWFFVGSLFWLLLVKLLTQTHILTFVILFKNSGAFQLIVGFHFSP
jgi:hypothetical protein